MQGDGELEGLQIADMDTAEEFTSKSTMKEGITILQPRIAQFHAKPNQFRIPFLLGGSAPSSTVVHLCLADSRPLISLILTFVAFFCAWSDLVDHLSDISVVPNFPKWTLP